MELPKRTLIIMCLALLASLILALCAAAYYYMEFENLSRMLESDQNVMRVNICIDYKELNGTVVWYNDTVVPVGSNLLEATETVVPVNSTYYSAQQSSFVDAIDGVWNEGAFYWMWLSWDETQQNWNYGDVGADRYWLTNNEIVMWRYEFPDYT